MKFDRRGNARRFRFCNVIRARWSSSIQASGVRMPVGACRKFAHLPSNNLGCIGARASRYV
ncbi:hypothetical protein QA635_18930 [Bradyrhizobium brasilense]|uniref:hypothetical protein n=1 Tax=Bradyrhizobium brasilense TaxID=1419277 RepID=UPI0024B0D147|nr:hypothetical protein [Bradyrhizobium australafricanum]WFU36372.1 hypothetical protein QA635_18930 [Bradyrhizobium australafricanum]